MAKQQPNWTGWGLKFIGSLVYLYVVYQLWSNPLPSGSLSGSLAALGLGVLFAVAVLSTVSLFLMTLASIKMYDKEMAMWDWKTIMWSGGSLVILTIAGGAAGTWTAVALLGFVLASLGAGMSKM
ncbi:MAG: hypothetical protein KGH72_06165 [Candidatus Micrarchaeota archaeon]|nr:hypothetical protein [Candidatus Micrarchaeota archaeon]